MTNTEDTDWKKDFQVVVKDEFGKPYLSVTNNGYQWASIAIHNPEYEIPKIIAALAGYMAAMPKEPEFNGILWGDDFYRCVSKYIAETQIPERPVGDGEADPVGPITRNGIVCERFADNGAHSRWDIIDSDTGETIIEGVELEPVEEDLAICTCSPERRDDDCQVHGVITGGLVK